MYKKHLNLILAVGFLLLSGCQSTTMFGGEHFSIFPASSASTSAAVYDSIVNNNYLTGLPIKVDNVNNTIVLSGYVKTIRQSDTAEDIARKTPGVKAVQNNIIVRK